MKMVSPLSNSSLAVAIGQKDHRLGGVMDPPMIGQQPQALCVLLRHRRRHRTESETTDS
jgi:hypothetical protein